MMKNKVKNCRVCGVLLNDETWGLCERHQGRLLCRICRKSVRARQQREYRERRGHEHERQKRKELATNVLSHYGGGKLACVKCGEDDARVLSLDHINRRSAEERSRRVKGLANGGWWLYNKLKREGFPEGYQTLCMNCQWRKRIENKEKTRNDSKLQ